MRIPLDPPPQASFRLQIASVMLKSEYSWTYTLHSTKSVRFGQCLKRSTIRRESIYEDQVWPGELLLHR
jgi:hypothetical protein